MSLTVWLAFVSTSAVLLVVPGPTILTVIGYALSHGKRANAALVAGVALGDSTALCLSVLGLGPLLASSAWWFTVVKTIGGLYLLYLGISLFRKGVSSQKDETMENRSRRNVFFQTYLVTALNPKGIVFFIAFLPLFVTPGDRVTMQLWILSGTFVLMAALNTILYAVFASSARRFVESPSAQKGLKYAGGSLLSAAGLWALITR